VGGGVAGGKCAASTVGGAGGVAWGRSGGSVVWGRVGRWMVWGQTKGRVIPHTLGGPKKKGKQGW
jgi:hypothetical protein